MNRFINVHIRRIPNVKSISFIAMLCFSVLFCLPFCIGVLQMVILCDYKRIKGEIWLRHFCIDSYFAVWSHDLGMTHHQSSYAWPGLKRPPVFDSDAEVSCLAVALRIHTTMLDSPTTTCRSTTCEGVAGCVVTFVLYLSIHFPYNSIHILTCAQKSPPWWCVLTVGAKSLEVPITEAINRSDGGVEPVLLVVPVQGLIFPPGVHWESHVSRGSRSGGYGWVSYVSRSFWVENKHFWGAGNREFISIRSLAVFSMPSINTLFNGLVNTGNDP